MDRGIWKANATAHVVTESDIVEPLTLWMFTFFFFFFCGAEALRVRPQLVLFHLRVCFLLPEGNPLPPGVRWQKVLKQWSLWRLLTPVSHRLRDSVLPLQPQMPILFVPHSSSYPQLPPPLPIVQLLCRAEGLCGLSTCTGDGWAVLEWLLWEIPAASEVCCLRKC